MNSKIYTEILLKEFSLELDEICAWWCTHAFDTENGGLYGEIGDDNSVNKQADKGGNLYGRSLWFFSTVAKHLNSEVYRKHAESIYHYMLDHFVDKEHGGVFWMVDAKGTLVNSKKQLFVQAFMIYGLSAYYKLTSDKEALDLALSVFNLVESKARDTVNQGYLTVCDRDWSGQENAVREDETNALKIMDTHLHLCEAYTELYEACGSERVAYAIRHCLDCFDKHLIEKENRYLRTDLTADWKDRSKFKIYGHNVECSWLIWKAVKVLKDKELEDNFRPRILQLVDNCMKEGMGRFGEVFESYIFESKTLVADRAWWMQAEAMNGFLNAYELTNDEKYYESFLKSWNFIKQYQKDKINGEWHWNSVLDNIAPPKKNKVCNFKAPYHNGRAMMESYNRLRSLD
jgi:cellobiose epimerase